MSWIEALPELVPAQYQRHALQAEDRIWVEKNCYTDLWIAILQGLRLEPTAMLGPTLCVDFEGDQVTFYKPSLDELRALYGLQVQELTVWRPLLEHAREHLAQGRLIATESDAHWLPDTQGTDYRTAHTKTTIALASLDAEGEAARYFHNTGLYELSGEDFRETFRTHHAPDPTHLPLFAEVVHLERLMRRPTGELADVAHQLLRQRLRWRPRNNPLERFGERFALELPQLQQQGLAHFHAWAFASIRQMGSAMELSALFMRWLDRHLGSREREEAASAFTRIAQGQKTLILKTARAVNSGKPLDVSAAFADMATDWDLAMSQLD